MGRDEKRRGQAEGGLPMMRRKAISTREVPDLLWREDVGKFITYNDRDMKPMALYICDTLQRALWLQKMPVRPRGLQGELLRVKPAAAEAQADLDRILETKHLP